MKKLFLSLFICLSCVTFSFAQETTENFELPKNALGFFGKNLNSANGPIIFGINYQRWLNDYIGIQGTIANDYVNNFQKNGEDIFFNADLELQVKIIEHKFKNFDLKTKLYAWASAGFYTEDYFYIDYIYNDGEEIEIEEHIENTYILAGIGFGFDTIIHKHISIPFSFGYIASFSDEFVADFTISTGFRYRF
jgi:hypothetical protein